TNSPKSAFPAQHPGLCQKSGSTSTVVVESVPSRLCVPARTKYAKAPEHPKTPASDACDNYGDVLECGSALPLFTGLLRAKRSYFSLLNSISSPNSSGLRAFLVKSATTVAESLVSFVISLSLTLRKLRRLPSSDSSQTT